jgi:hypothetical protein
MVISGSTTVIKDVYALGHLAYQTDGAGNKLATFTYDANGTPSSVVIGSGTTTNGPWSFGARRSCVLSRQTGPGNALPPKNAK